MFNEIKITTEDKHSFYEILILQMKALLDGENNAIANLSNSSAFLFSMLENLNWAGFYILHQTKPELILGPFQGKVACVHIPVGRGVCGSAVKDNKTYLVKNVHEFEGHIACDGNSNSEIVIPICKNGQVIGVLDIDSPILARFDEIDQKYLEEIAKIIENSCDISILQCNL